MSMGNRKPRDEQKYMVCLLREIKRDPSYALNMVMSFTFDRCSPKPFLNNAFFITETYCRE